MKKVIVAEDDAGVQDSIRMVLEDAGYDVTVLSGGESLLGTEYDLPDVFILDKQLSGVDGLDICRFLKTQGRTKNIPVIMISASSRIDMLAKDAQADGVLEKPFRIEALRDMVARHTA
ncbi:response regulator [Polluticoccus soli]|uniref:response regulator n=1 Tax=Polluticoccus soli TaxID=3034150 RepID=UPI0023E2A734|nr:response regulator [Flavipsychrobacter sp. JY13-12]